MKLIDVDQVKGVVEKQLDHIDFGIRYTQTDARDEDKDKTQHRDAMKKKHEEDRQANAPKFREWTSATGKFHKTARFRGMAGSVAKLELEDGSTISVPLKSLATRTRSTSVSGKDDLRVGGGR